MTHFHKSTNYGGVLQAYALCKYLNDQGHTATQILYTAKNRDLRNKPLSLKQIYLKSVAKVNRKIYRNKNWAIKNRMEALFQEFRNEVPHTKQEYTKENIAEISNDFDAFIVGSDQVWNPVWYDASYMLDFVGSDAKKISYAASMGVSSIDKEQKCVYQAHLRDFHAISVREQAAAEALVPIVNREVNVSVDPTLLLSVDDWNEIASERKVKEKYVFLYLLGEDAKARKLAEKFAKVKDLKLVMIPDLLGTYRKKDRCIQGERILDATPCDFISLIKYAEYVLTDSFHASVFSLLYHKDFFAFQREGSVKMGSRIRDLTQLFGCLERFCANRNDMNLNHLLSLRMIDYSEECAPFIKEKQNSMDYLKTNLR